MPYPLKKMYATIMALLLTVSSQVYSDCGRSSTDEADADCCSCAPSCCGGAFISADLLYWRAFEGGLDDCFPIEAVDYALSDGEIISRFRGKGKDPNFDWDPGFRVGAGYNFACGWDLAAFWTHFYSHSSRHQRNDYEFGVEQELRWKLDFEVVIAESINL